MYKKSSDFSMDVDFKKFPFDTQELKIELALIVPSEQVLISFDYEGFKDNEEKVRDFSLNDWNIRDFYVTVDNFISTASRGGREQHDKQPRKFKTLTVRIPIERYLQGPIVSVILPLIAVGLMAIAVLFIRNNSFAEMSSTAFLFIVTYSTGYAQFASISNTLTLTDILFYVTVSVVILPFIKFLLLNSDLLSEQAKKQLERNGNVIAIVCAGLYVVIVITLFYSG